MNSGPIPYQMYHFTINTDVTDEEILIDFDNVLMRACFVKSGETGNQIDADHPTHIQALTTIFLLYLVVVVVFLLVFNACRPPLID